MSRTSGGAESYEAAKILIGKLDYKWEGNILEPFYKCTIIDVAGGIWDIDALAFTATEERIRELWDKETHLFTKRII